MEKRTAGKVKTWNDELAVIRERQKQKREEAGKVKDGRKIFGQTEPTANATGKPCPPKSMQ